eukprot:3282428-Pleurochrysis_carterae.AAC.4
MSAAVGSARTQIGAMHGDAVLFPRRTQSKGRAARACLSAASNPHPTTTTYNSTHASTCSPSPLDGGSGSDNSKMSDETRRINVES